jgi:hypothetical protein
LIPSEDVLAAKNVKASGQPLRRRRPGLIGGNDGDAIPVGGRPRIRRRRRNATDAAMTGGDLGVASVDVSGEATEAAVHSKDGLGANAVAAVNSMHPSNVSRHAVSRPESSVQAEVLGGDLEEDSQVKAADIG